MPKMIYEHTDQTEKDLAVIKRQGYIMNVNVSNKSKVIDFAVETLAKIIEIQPELVNSVINNK